MAIREPRPAPIRPQDIRGTVWEHIATLSGGRNPFAFDSPRQGEQPLLAVGEARRVVYRGSGEITLYNVDLPSGVTLNLELDGVSRRYSHGNEAGALRWEQGLSPYRFTSTLEAIITNTTASPQAFRFHVSGA